MLDSQALSDAVNAIRADEFEHIALTNPIGTADGVVIRYSVAGFALMITFAVSSELSLVDEPVVEQAGTLTSVSWSEQALNELTMKLCTNPLYVLIKRYQFLQNSSKRDDSLQKYFVADARGEQTQIDYYPLMTLMTAYFESH